MNKLEEYKKTLKISNASHGFGVSEGFDAAIALDLPVKFAEWANKNRWYSFEQGVWKQTAEHGSAGKTPTKTSKELYQYWLDNVFKID